MTMRLTINAVKEKEFRGTLLLLLFLISSSALGAGYFFMDDPTGRTLGFSVSYLRYSAFADYFWPGWILFISIGVYGLVCLLLVANRYRNYPRHLMLQGLVLLVWIVIQIIMVRDFNLLHALCVVIGLIFCITGKMIADS